MICTKNCDIDLKKQMRKFYANINILSRKFAKCSPDVKCTLFKSFCSNMYCSTMWYNGTVTAMRKLRIAYNNSLCRLLGIPKYNSASEMFVQLNIKSFGELLRKYVFCFININKYMNKYLLFLIILYWFLFVTPRFQSSQTFGIGGTTL